MQWMIMAAVDVSLVRQNPEEQTLASFVPLMPTSATQTRCRPQTPFARAKGGQKENGKQMLSQDYVRLCV